MDIVIGILLIWLAIFLIRMPIIIAKARGISGGNLTTIAILSWAGILLGITWIVALVLALVYQSQVNISNVANGQVMYLSHSNESPMSSQNQSPMISNLDKLEKLASLKEKGIITEQEFTIEKRKLLNL